MIKREQILNTSIFIALIRYLFNWYGYTKQTVLVLYKNSQLYKIIGIFASWIKESFIYRIRHRSPEIKEGGNLILLSNSRFIRWLLTVSNACRNKSLDYLNASRIVGSVRRVSKELYLSPLKAANIIIVTAILINVLLALLFKRKIEFLGWFMRACLLSIGVWAISSGAVWEDVKQTSYFMKYIGR